MGTLQELAVAKPDLHGDELARIEQGCRRTTHRCPHLGAGVLHADKDMDRNFVVVGGNVQGILLGIGVLLCDSPNTVLGQGVGIAQVALLPFATVGDGRSLGRHLGGPVDAVNRGPLNIHVGSEELGGVDHIERGFAASCNSFGDLEQIRIAVQCLDVGVSLLDLDSIASRHDGQVCLADGMDSIKSVWGTEDVSSGDLKDV